MDNDQTRKLKALEFLCDNRLGVLSTVTNGNKPHSALIYYVVEGKDIYFITVDSSRKYPDILSNNQVSLVVSKETPPIELQIEGSAQAINDPALKSHISSLYLEKANKNSPTVNWPPVLKLPHLDGFMFIKITIDWFKFSDFSQQEALIVEGTPQDW